ncbi:MAG: BatD family protein [Planctomycetes bacterium]|nr:BatD family protein [Planctomycetota bacterium]
MTSATRHCLAAVLLTVAVCAQDEPVTITVAASSLEPVVGQSVTITLAITYDDDFFEQHGVPLLQRRVDVPFHVALDWELVGTTLTWHESEGGDRVVLGEREVGAMMEPPVSRAGHMIVPLILSATWSAVAAGEYVLPAPRLRYAHTTRFETSLLGGRQPIDRHEATVTANELVLMVRELPDSGRPAGFSGAIGEFAMRVEVPATVEVGDSFAMVMAVTGSGNLAEFAAPPWPELPGFGVQGLTDDSSDGQRRFTFDVLALREGAALPPIAFTFYSPGSASYRTVESEVPALRVLARSSGRAMPDRVARLVAADADARGAGGAGSWWWLAIAILCPVLPLLVRRRRSRTRREVQRG